ncbi:DUF2784 family protein [Olivibacter sp. 47]|nr:DUF2784 family protein [Olivibacter sp. 47]MDM8175986.1 DUF2784 family protein [Olivibacter sp. 47]
MEKYIYLFLTQLTVIIHLLFIFFVVIGGFFLNKSLWISILHPSSVIWGVYAELSSGVICPLTALEIILVIMLGFQPTKKISLQDT